MRQLQVLVLYDFLLHIHCVLFFSPASSATARFIPSPPSKFWLTHSSFCSWRGNPTSPHGIFSSAVPASACLESVSQFPRVRIHWYESPFPWVNCKPSFWIDCPWLKYHRTRGLFSCAHRREESRVSWYKACPPGWEDPGTVRVFLRRANVWVGVTGPIQYPEVLQSRANWIGMAAEHVESGQVHPTHLQLPQMYYGTLLWKHGCWLRLPLTAAVSRGVEKPCGASQFLPFSPPSLLKIARGPVQVVAFGVREGWGESSGYLSPG